MIYVYGAKDDPGVHRLLNLAYRLNVPIKYCNTELESHLRYVYHAAAVTEFPAVFVDDTYMGGVDTGIKVIERKSRYGDVEG